MITCIFFGLFGLAFGSFLNVCIIRLPAGESVAWPRSHCRQCDRPIASFDNIPILSWVLLGAACRACGGRISWRYPAIELATCTLFVMCCVQFPLPWLSACWAVLCFLLLGLAVMDTETLLLPDLFTIPGLVAGLIFSALCPGLERGVWSWDAAMKAAGKSLLAAALAAGVLLAIAGAYWLLRRRMGVGMGDVKLLAMLAAWMGLRQTGLVLFLAVVVGAVYGLGVILIRRNDTSDEETPLPASQLPIPFGTMLSLAGIYGVFLGERTLGWYMQFFH